MEDIKNISQDNDKLIESIKKFVNSYKNLAPAGKAAFEAQIKAQTKKMDERTKRLYEALIEATKNEMSVDRTIQEMEKVDRHLKHGV